jgi:hypothetical protein
MLFLFSISQTLTMADADIGVDVANLIIDDAATVRAKNLKQTARKKPRKSGTRGTEKVKKAEDQFSKLVRLANEGEATQEFIAALNVSTACCCYCCYCCC